MADQQIPASRVEVLVHALEDCQEHHRAEGDDYVAAQWGIAAGMARGLLAPDIEDLSLRADYDRDDYLWCQAAIGRDMHGVIVGWDDEDCPILVTQEGYHGPEYTHLVRPLTHLPRLEWPAVTHESESVSESDGMSEPESATESADTGECQIEGVANPPYDTNRLYRDRDGDVWEHIDGLWLAGRTHKGRAELRGTGAGLSDLPAAYAPYTPVEADECPIEGVDVAVEHMMSDYAPAPDLPRPEDVPAGELWLVRYQSKVTAGHRPAPHSTFPWTLLVGTSHNAATDSDITLIRRVEVNQ